MWYGASAPAPACRIHPLHRSSSSPLRRRRRQVVDLQPLPSWGPALELRLKREAERKKALASDRKLQSSQFLAKGLSLEDAKWLADMNVRPMSTGQDGVLRQLIGGNSNSKLAPPPLRPSTGGGRKSFNRGSNRQSLPELTVSRLSSGGSISAIVTAMRITPKLGERRLSRLSPSGGLQVPGGKASSSRRPSRTVSEEGHPPVGTPTKVQANMLKSKRRNSLCDRLLDAKLSKLDVDQRKTLLLQGGRRGSVQGHFKQSQAQTQQEPAAKASVAPRISVAGALSMQIPKQPDRFEAAFKACSSSGVVTTGTQLAESLLLLGHPYPDCEVLDRTIHDMCAGRESLDKEDFMLVVSTYEEELGESLEATFTAHAALGDEVPAGEVPEMLREMGVPLMTGMEEELMDLADDIDFEAWESIYEEVVSRAGLTQEEHNRLRLIFEELEGLDGTITAQELLGALSWHESLTELAGGGAVLQALVEETLERVSSGRVGLDPSQWTKVAAAATVSRGSAAEVGDSTVRANGSAFLAAASVFHSRISMGLRAALERLGLGTDEVPSNKLLAIFEELGFLGAMASDVDSFLLACNMQGKEELTYFEFFTIVFRYCQADGVTEDESKDINAVFKKFDEDESGTLEATEIGPVIRWLGYQPTQYRVYDFAEEIGLDWHSHIDALEFRRLAAKYKSMSLKTVRKAFLHKDRATDDHKIAITELNRLLHLVGYEPTQDEVANLVREAGGQGKFIDFHEFKRLELIHRRWVQQTMARNGGFTDGELAKHYQYFASRDMGSGMISGLAMRELMFEIFPDDSKDRHRHAFIAMLLNESGIEGNVMVEFDEFMEVMKKTQEEIDRDMLIQSLRLKSEFGFTGAEVKQFRDLFSVTDEDMSGDVDFEEVITMFSNLMVLDVSSKREILAHVMEVGNEDGRIDFWGFLSVMHKVQSKKWAGTGFSRGALADRRG